MLPASFSPCVVSARSRKFRRRNPSEAAASRIADEIVVEANRGDASPGLFAVTVFTNAEHGEIAAEVVFDEIFVTDAFAPNAISVGLAVANAIRAYANHVEMSALKVHERLSSQ